MKKSTFLPKFHIFCTILTFLHQNWYWQKHLSLSSKFAWHYFITLLRNSVIRPKTDAFCIKCYFLLKQNNATKNWHFSKTENTPLRILNISIKKLKYLKTVTIGYKNEKKKFKIGVSARFSLLPVKHT